MSNYRPGTHINVASYDTPKHFAPAESWKDRDRRADKRRERRERARRTVTRQQGPPDTRKEDGNAPH